MHSLFDACLMGQRAGGISANTYFLAHFNGTNGQTSHTDEAGHTITTVSAAALSTAQSKFGGSSLFIDDTSKRLTVNPTEGGKPQILFNGRDWTIECFVRFTVNNTSASIILCNGNGITNPCFSFSRLGTSSSSFLNIGDRLGHELNASGVSTINTWYHVAACRSSGTTRLFVDGVMKDKTTLLDLPDVGTLSIGNRTNVPVNAPFYIDDLRISANAIYNSDASFTPPAAPLN